MGVWGFSDTGIIFIYKGELGGRDISIRRQRQVCIRDGI